MVGHALPLSAFLARLAIGAVLGQLIGFERQLKGSSAGLHTTGLVAGGAAIFASIQPAAGEAGAERIIANIVTGVGFLAGGVIFRQGGTVSGLNTAATIWSTAAVGALAGLGLFREATIAAFAIIAMNVLMDLAASSLERRKRTVNARTR